jgi:hypothetical protein
MLVIAAEVCISYTSAYYAIYATSIESPLYACSTQQSYALVYTLLRTLLVSDASATCCRVHAYVTLN